MVRFCEGPPDALTLARELIENAQKRRGLGVQPLSRTAPVGRSRSSGPDWIRLRVWRWRFRVLGIRSIGCRTIGNFVNARPNSRASRGKKIWRGKWKPGGNKHAK